MSVLNARKLKSMKTTASICHEEYNSDNYFIAIVLLDKS